MYSIILNDYSNADFDNLILAIASFHDLSSARWLIKNSDQVVIIASKKDFICQS